MNCYLGHSNNSNIRYEATSGGIGTTIVKYLFDYNKIGTAISFQFGTQYYTPKLIYNFDDFSNIGSIYHNIDMVDFIRKSINKIEGNMVVFCLPCQVKPIRHILSRNKIKSYIIALTCSAQQTKEATTYLIKRSISLSGKVNKIRYRGGGWPGGVKIEDTEGNVAFYSNNDSLWKQIFHSKLFILNQCFKCNETISEISDISLADPWGIDKIGEEKNGNSLIFANNKVGLELLEIALKKDYIDIQQLDYENAIISQKYTILRKSSYKKHKTFVFLYRKIINNKFYRFLVLKYPIIFRLHCIAINAFDKILIKLK